MSAKTKKNLRGAPPNHKSKGQRLEAMARKREERAARAAYKKEKKMESYFDEDENFQTFSSQLAKLGLQLRDIPGDGNCLFRALGDQLEGHGRNHFKHRLDVVKYMIDNRKDFEPFVEDDVPFDRHVAELKKLGTYAGNDAIVAFARLCNVNMVIHQLNSPVWRINGTDKPNARELHISYHNGDHYSSVRKLGDNTETPTNIRLQHVQTKDGVTTTEKQKTKKQKSMQNGTTNTYHSHSALFYQDEAAVEGMARAIRDETAVEDNIMATTGCVDRELVRQTLEENFYDVDATLSYLLQLDIVMSNSTNLHHSPVSNHSSMEDSASISSQYTTDSGIWSDNGTGTRLFGCTTDTSTYNGTTTGAKPKASVKQMSAREKKDQAKREKKKRAEERHRQRVLAGKPPTDFSDDDATTVISQDMAMLQI